MNASENSKFVGTRWKRNIIAIPASHCATARAVNAFWWFLSFLMCFPLKVFFCSLSVCKLGSAVLERNFIGKPPNREKYKIWMEINTINCITKITSWTQSLHYKNMTYYLQHESFTSCKPQLSPSYARAISLHLSLSLIPQKCLYHDCEESLLFTVFSQKAILNPIKPMTLFFSRIQGRIVKNLRIHII